MITFVIYHVPLPKQTVKASKILPSFHRHGVDYERLLDLAFRSAVLFHPGCKMVLLTSRDHQPVFYAELSHRVEICRYDTDNTQPILSRNLAELTYLQTHDFASPVVMMDGDMLINANFESFFERDFDVALTYNEGKTETDKKMPINGGLKLINNKNPQVAIEFFQKVYDICCSEKLKEFRTWWGDQYALIEAVDAHKFWNRTQDRIQVDGVAVQLLSCEEYNFTPPKRAREIKRELKNKKIIHFRGGRKKYMSMYWRLYLALQEKRDFCGKIGALITRVQLYCGMLLQCGR